jgi:hypothetical protein
MQELTTPLEATSEQLQAVTDLLLGKTAEKPTPETVNQATEEVQTEEPATPDPVEPEKEIIDYEKEIPLSTGEKVKLGALKDAYQAQHTKTLEMTERENRLMRQQDEIERLAAHMGSLPPELVAKSQAEIQQQLQREHHLMLEAIPAWKDKGQFDLGRGAIHALATEYGAEKLVSQVTDHRIVKMLNDFAQLKAAIKASGAAIKPLRSSEPSAKVQPIRGASQEVDSLINRAKASKSQSDQVAAINALFRSK